jgi:hypothetical protein
MYTPSGTIMFFSSGYASTPGRLFQSEALKYATQCHFLGEMLPEEGEEGEVDEDDDDDEGK